MLKMIFGLVLIVVGSLVVIKSEKVYESLGAIEFFEEKLASYGGSRLGYKLIGLFISFIGILLFTGLYSGFMETVMSPLINAGKPDSN